MLCIVVPNADKDACNEALGRLYAASRGEPYPIPGRFPDGTINPDPEFATRYYTMPLAGANGTEFAFAADTLVQSWLGQTVAVDGGNYTIPSGTQELAEEWFWAPE